MATYYQDPFGASDYSAEGMPSLLSLSNLESLTRGSVAGLLGLPGEVQRLLLDKKYQPNLPSTEQLLATTPRMTAPTPQAGLLEDIGGFMSPVPAAAVKPAVKAAGKAGKAVARMAGEEINAAMMGERGGLLGAVTPQPMYVIEKNPSPFIVKHGTNQPFNEFKSGMGITAKHIYTTPEDYAQDAAKYGDTLITAQASPKSLIDFSSEGKLDKQTINALKKAAKDAGIIDKYYPFESFMNDLMSGQLYQVHGGPSQQNALLSELFSK